MIACLDVDYRDVGAVAVCLVFDQWHSAAASNVYAAMIQEVQPYEPGAFYKRELPCLMEALGKVGERLECIVVDSYVFLDDAGKKGLGAHLYDALHGAIPVIGVAKTKFLAAEAIAREVVRGDSKNPLFVTAVGIGVDWAAEQVARMHGNFRLPTLLKEVDRLCRNL